MGTAGFGNIQSDLPDKKAKCEFNVRAGVRFESHQCASHERREKKEKKGKKENLPSSRLRMEPQQIPRFINCRKGRIHNKDRRKVHKENYETGGSWKARVQKIND